MLLSSYTLASFGIALLVCVLAGFKFRHYRKRLQKAYGLLHTRQAELRTARKQARKQSFRDPLTGLPNQEFLLAYLARAISGAEKEKQALALGVFAIRDLEQLEQTHGHLLVEELIRMVASTLRQSGGFPASIAKGQFAVVFKNVGDPASATLKAKHLIMDASGDYELQERFIATELAGGLVLFPEHATDAAELLRKANLAAVKGRNSKAPLTFYEPGIELHAQDLILVSELKKVLAVDGLSWVYQPQYAIHEEAVIGAEILVRWLHPRFGLVPADHFIPLAEQCGLINQITQRAINQAKSILTRWRSEGRDWRLSINVSANDLESAGRVNEMLLQFEDYAPMITLEITETAIMKNVELIVQNVEKLKGAKVSLSLDDYGTGYSSLAHLKEFHFDEIKIDKCFIHNITRSERDFTLTKASIHLAHELGAVVVAEGVEDFETARLLVGMGCDILQGYAISHPLYYDQLIHFLENAEVSFA